MKQIQSKFARWALAVPVFTIATGIWLFDGVLRVIPHDPGEGCWVLARRCIRGPGWEDGLHLYLGIPGWLEITLWLLHLTVAFVLVRIGAVRRLWPIVLWPALVGQVLLVLSFA